MEEPRGRKRQRRSAVWEHFTPTDAGTEASCKKCSRLMKTKNGCTTTLWKHLENVHSIKPAAESSSEWNGASMLDTMGIFAAVDGLSYRCIANSQLIGPLYKAATKSALPVSPTTISQWILKCYEDKKLNVIKDIKKIQAASGKFSVSLDEWTSGANRRYCNINLHREHMFWNLGLVRIRGSFTSKACLEMLNNKLFEFGLQSPDTVALVTDGAAVMKKFGRLSGTNHQLCFAHGIHLAVSDVLYSKTTVAGAQMDNEASTEDGHCEHEDETGTTEGGECEDEIETGNTVDGDSEDEIETGSTQGSDCEDEDDIETGTTFDEEPSEEIVYEENLQLLIKKVRQIVKSFKASPLKSELLEINAKTLHIKELKLILDSKTRWNSMLQMLQRFIYLKGALQKTFIDTGESTNFSEGDFDKLEEVIQILDPIKLAVESICRRDATLPLADTALKWMLDKLSLCDSDLGREMFSSMKRRIQERRHVISEVASCLHLRSENFDGHSEGYFLKSTRKDLIEKIKSLYLLKSVVDSGFELEDNVEASQFSEPLVLELSLSGQLELVLNKTKNFRTVHEPATERNLSSAIRREMQTLRATGRRGPILESVYEMLLTIPPSSVEAERVFSSANNFCTRNRSRLGDNSLNALVFLKWYYNIYLKNVENQ